MAKQLSGSLNLDRVEAPKEQLRTVKARQQHEKYQELSKEINDLKTKVPSSPKFYEKELSLPTASKAQVRKAAKLDLRDLRNALVRFTDKDQVATYRTELQDLLKKFPFSAELHALQAVQHYSDALQSGAMKLDKFALVEHSLLEMNRAVLHGADSIFNLHWYANIYQSYLKLLEDKYKRQKNQAGPYSQHGEGWMMQNLVHHQHLVKQLHAAPGKLLGMKKLLEVFKGSKVLYTPVPKLAVAEAADLVLKGQPKQKVKTLKEMPLKAEHVLFIQFVTLNMAANIPLLWPWVRKKLKEIPEVHRDLVLQKKQVVGQIKAMEFQLAMMDDDKRHARSLAIDLFDFYQETANEYLQSALLTRQYEADPFVKAGWVIRQSHGLFPPAQIQGRIQKARHLVQQVLGPRGQVEALQGMAENLRYELSRLSNLYADAK